MREAGADIARFMLVKITLDEIDHQRLYREVGETPSICAGRCT